MHTHTQFINFKFKYISLLCATEKCGVPVRYARVNLLRTDMSEVLQHLAASGFTQTESESILVCVHVAVYKIITFTDIYLMYVLLKRKPICVTV